MLHFTRQPTTVADSGSRDDGQCGRVYGTLTAAAVQDARLARLSTK